MKNLNKEEELTYNALLYNIRTSPNTGHLARLREFVEIMLLAQYGQEEEKSLQTQE